MAVRTARGRFGGFFDANRISAQSLPSEVGPRDSFEDSTHLNGLTLMNALSNVKVAGKLYALILIMGLAIIGIASLNWGQIGKVYDAANVATVKTVPSFKTIYEIQDAFRLLQISSRDHLSASDPATMAALDKTILEQRETIKQKLDYYERNGLAVDGEDMRLLNADRAALNEYLPQLDARLALSRQNKKDEARGMIASAEPSVIALDQALQNHIAYNGKLAVEGSANARAEKAAALQTTIFIGSVSLVLISLVGWLIAKREFSRPIGRVTDSLVQLASGSLDVKIAGTERHDEVGDIARAAQVFKEFVQKLDAQSWVKTNEAKIGAELQQATTIQDLAQKTMSMLCPLVSAQHGLFYVLTDDKLEMCGRYGYRERKHLNTVFAIGEGLVGQCAMDRQPITITEPPEDYIQINSGLGETTPAVIAVIPVTQSGNLRGVVELAALKPFSPREMALLDQLMPALATHLELLERSIAAQLLLKETQEQAARMEAQAAQLEEQSVEMEAQQTELAATESWYRSIIAKSPDGALVVDVKGTIVLSNAKLEEMFGYEPGKMDGLSVDVLVPLSIRPEHYKKRDGFMKTGGTRPMGAGLELMGVRADGSEFPVEIGLSQLPDVGGRGLCAYASVRDVTDRRAAQMALKEAKEAAEAATKAKGDFLASMSHEIRTPMNGITGMADLLAQSNLDDDQKHMLKTIRESGNSLITVINDILDFSKIEAGKLDLEDVSMSVADALEGVASTLTPNASKKGIRINTFVDPAIPEALRGDAVRVRQVLFNLSGNAVKFSDNKDVTLRATIARADADGRMWVRFDVIDQGIGISEEGQAKLFQAFSQAESSTTRKFGGTGLGLAICKRLVEMMGGTIGMKSKMGEGSVFTAELPFYPSDASRSHEKPRDLQGLRVLLVGSPKTRQETIVSYLTHWGADVVTVPTDQGVAENIAMAEKEGHAYSSIMLDLGLEGERQVAAVGLIRASAPKRETPMILLQDYQARGPRIREADVVTIDANPIVRYRIVTAVAVAAGRASPQVQVDAEVLAVKSSKAPTVEEAAAQGQLILLAEDNLTNQDVIRRQLGMLGFACEIANDGAEALKAWRTGRHVLLLTDCHMPEMDGYDLAGAIRAEEKASGQRLPIVAVTANALQGEAERCIAAGMDDYVSKPIAMPALIAALKKWMPPPRNPPAGPVNTNDGEAPKPTTIVKKANPALKPESDVIDPRAIRDTFGDDDDTYREILQSFVEPSREIIADIVSACERRKAGDVNDAAHKLKSSARTVGANALADTCIALEAAGKASDWTVIDKLTPTAAAQFQEVENYISGL
jgi:two-component system, sensor histidine kinase and response regulator